MKFLSMVLPTLAAHCSAKDGGASPSDPKISVACRAATQGHTVSKGRGNSAWRWQARTRRGSERVKGGESTHPCKVRRARCCWHQQQRSRRRPGLVDDVAPGLARLAGPGCRAGLTGPGGRGGTR